jgi:C4-dicarboxylate-specific signal transduction histidine kinase
MGMIGMMKEELAARGNEADRFARVAHELTAPVNLISGSLQNLEESFDFLVKYVRETSKFLDQHDDPAALRAQMLLDRRLESASELWRICSEGTRRLNFAVGQLRSCARPAVGAERVVIQRVLESSLRLALHGRQPQPSVHREFPSDPVCVAASGDALGQVFGNLLGNACDALADVARPKLFVTVKEMAGGGGKGIAEVRVRDNGPGVAAAHRESVFAQYFTTKRSTSGLGLGLAISRDIIERCGGTIGLAQAEEPGAEFVVQLPLAGPA